MVLCAVLRPPFVGLGVALSAPHGLSQPVMIALITEKLQNQCLDEVTNSSAQQASLIYKDGASNQVPLSVEGKNVWTSPDTLSAVEREADISGDNNTSCDDNEHVQAVLCSHDNVLHKCIICDTNSNKAPPNKRHCRSISVPVNSMASSPCQTDCSKLWRPIAVIPLSKNGTGQHSSDSTQFRCLDFKKSQFPRIVHSADSGHFTTSDFQSPSCSPVMRPASALSSFSQTGAGASWLDCYQQDNHRFEILQKRSLSYEEEVSLGAVSTPSSPYRHKIPRCRSQPCILHDRKFAKKRRREGCRPTINFQKMTETAYNRYRRSDPVFTPGSEFQNRTSLFSHGMDSVMNLMPIASSPLDTDFPIRNLGDRLTKVVTVNPSDEATETADSSEIDIQQPVRLIGDDDPESGCGCHGDDLDDDGIELFHLTDLDIEQIENH